MRAVVLGELDDDAVVAAGVSGVLLEGGHIQVAALLRGCAADDGAKLLVIARQAQTCLRRVGKRECLHELGHGGLPRFVDNDIAEVTGRKLQAEQARALRKRCHDNTRTRDVGGFHGKRQPFWTAVQDLLREVLRQHTIRMQMQNVFRGSAVLNETFCDLTCGCVRRGRDKDVRDRGALAQLTDRVHNRPRFTRSGRAPADVQTTFVVKQLLDEVALRFVEVGAEVALLERWFTGAKGTGRGGGEGAVINGTVLATVCRARHSECDSVDLRNVALFEVEVDEDRVALNVVDEAGVELVSNCADNFVPGQNRGAFLGKTFHGETIEIATGRSRELRFMNIVEVHIAHVLRIFDIQERVK
eukprot:PhM_4_TR15913/c3_g1_i1/m.3424